MLKPIKQKLFLLISNSKTENVHLSYKQNQDQMTGVEDLVEEVVDTEGVVQEDETDEDTEVVVDENHLDQGLKEDLRDKHNKIPPDKGARGLKNKPS